MKKLMTLRIVILLVPFVFLTFLTSTSFGQQGSGATGGLEKSPQAQEFDKKALEKLRTMTPEEVEKLDKKLAQALTLFYDREYARALPIFREISDLVETFDVMFWYASCAAKAGESELAIKKFREMLDVDPNLHRVRLELATVYYELGRYKDARDELNRVLEAKPPETVRDNIRKLLAAIDARTKRLFTNARFSGGIQRDSNVNAAPEDTILILPPNGGLLGTGGTLILNERQKELSDWVIVDSFAGNALYDLGENKGWMWNTTGTFYQSHVLKYHEFGLTQYSASTGPWYVSQKGVLKLPIGYTKTDYEHDPLFSTYFMSPSYEYFFTGNFSLRGGFTYSKDEYDPVDKAQQENINREYEISPSFFFNNRRDILTLSFSTEDLNADAQRYSYDAINGSISYYKRLGGDMEVYGRFKYSDRDYEGPVQLWPYNREDKKYNLYLVLSKNFMKYYFASINYNFIRNSSNTALYDFKKHVYGINLGFKF